MASQQDSTGERGNGQQQEDAHSLNETVNQSTPFNALTGPQRQDIRASQRTFEGAYIRTAFSELGIGLLVIRLFAREFLPIGTVFITHAILMVSLGLYQRNYMEFVYDRESRVFITGGYSVLLAAALALGAQVALMVLLLKI